jgi:hypothetical protein
MGRGFKGARRLVLVTVTACWQLAGCGGRAVTSPALGDSAGISSDAGTSGSSGTVASGDLDAGTAAAGVGGGQSTSTPDIDGYCVPDVCCQDDSRGRAALSGQPCPVAGRYCGLGYCALSCTCIANDAGALAWECMAPPCLK